jgi:hypothetical protein
MSAIGAVCLVSHIIKRQHTVNVDDREARAVTIQL